MNETLRRGTTPRKKKMKTMVFRRNHSQLEATIKILKRNNTRFDIHHSSYSTKIHFPDTDEKIMYTTYNYRDVVFTASRSIIKDLEANPLAHEVAQLNWSTKNFDSKNGWQPNRCDAVINIDISKAYASCLLNSGLITEKTFRFLNSLKKHERLPAVGMIAKRSVVYRYNDGECVSFGQVNGKWTNVFFYIIAQVTEIMNECKRIAGDYFCFYWVDGIFIDHRIDKQTLAQIELCLQDGGFKYKYEKCENFKAHRDSDKVYVSMVKNGEPKNYCFRDANLSNNFRDVLERIRNEGVNLTNYEQQTQMPDD